MPLWISTFFPYIANDEWLDRPHVCGDGHETVIKRDADLD